MPAWLQRPVYICIYCECCIYPWSPPGRLRCRGGMDVRRRHADMDAVVDMQTWTSVVATRRADSDVLSHGTRRRRGTLPARPVGARRGSSDAGAQRSIVGESRPLAPGIHQFVQCSYLKLTGNGALWMIACWRLELERDHMCLALLKYVMGWWKVRYVRPSPYYK
jgi:hypothetical protein